jgi:hypothetical protein
MDLHDLTTALVKDTSARLEATDYDNALFAAYMRYSGHRPRVIAEDLPGNGTHDLDLPGGWVPDFSAIVTAEYPVGIVPANMLDRDLWQIYRSPDGEKLRILHAALTALETVRVGYTIYHDEESIPAGDINAIAALAASYCLLQLAAVFGQSTDPTIQADVVDYKSKTDEYRRLADVYAKQYNNHLGLKDSDTTPAAMVTARPPKRRRTRLTHW